MSSSEKEALESQIQSLMEGKGLEKEEVESSSKSKKPYVWTEKRKAAFDKMRDGLAMKVEVTKQMKKEKRDLEKKDIKARIQKIMNPSNSSGGSSSAHKAHKKQDMETSSEDECVSAASSSEEEERPRHKKNRSTSKERPIEKSVKSGREGKRKVEREVVKESESEESESEDESYEIASAKQKQHYRDSKLKIGKAQRSTNVLNALDKYILL